MTSPERPHAEVHCGRPEAVYCVWSRSGVACDVHDLNVFRSLSWAQRPQFIEVFRNVVTSIFVINRIEKKRISGRPPDEHHRP
jgi:hypothetical protein